ncbi:class I SAM-dependent methyltransferase [Candidatus Bathyarchaeota archaeon]|nr:class I SAM-dependent methyltransferase [Candidatus Bathyarchaeota archaeon]
MDKTDYGNWMPQKFALTFLVLSVAAFCVTFMTGNRHIKGVSMFVSAVLAAFFLYLAYTYWLLEKNDKGVQRRFWGLVVDHLPWDGQGAALDIGTGSGPVAIALAKRYPEAAVKGIDYWGEPWSYSLKRCEDNARAEGVSGRVSFERADAASLPFADDEFDAVVSSFVFHAIDVEDRITLIREALRVLRRGGAYAFLDLFNDQFYDKGFLDDVRGWGLADVGYIDAAEFIDIPLALRMKHMAGGSGVLYGVK